MSHTRRVIPAAQCSSRARLAHRLAVASLASLCLSVIATRDAEAQRRNQRPDELRGSKQSVEKMYDFARAHGLPFYLTPTNVDNAIAGGRLVALTGDSTYELTRGVGFSYATKEARQFVLAFAPQYLSACGVPLMVTSAARPMSRQPHNANPHSVHPTGIAVDLRRPPAGPCLDWVRASLTELERRGVIEATEERHPVHLHLAVLVPPGGRLTLPQLVSHPVPRVVIPPAITVANAAGDVSLSPRTGASAAAAKTGGLRTYVVRQGDTLWDIAKSTGVTIEALAKANNRKPKAPLKPGTSLMLPNAGSAASR